MDDDGHSPETCNYMRCIADSATPCPFLKDGGVQLPPSANTYELGCKHEWRQYFDYDATFGFMPDGYYCIHCTERQPGHE